MKKFNIRTLTFRLAAILACLTLLTSYMLSGMYAKYMTVSSSSSAGARPARFIVVYTDYGPEKQAKIPITLSPGTSERYSFGVSREREDGTRSEVEYKYTIKIEDCGNLPLEYEIDGEPYDPTKEYLRPLGAGTIYYRHYLTVTWKADANDYRLADEIDLITITVRAVQID